MTASALLEAVRARLLADPAVVGAVGSRVYAFGAPEDAAFPVVVVSVPEMDMPDDAYTPTRAATLDVMVIARSWSAVDAIAGRVKVLFDLTPLVVGGGMDVFDLRLTVRASYSEREGRDILYYGTARLRALYMEG